MSEDTEDTEDTPETPRLHTNWLLAAELPDRVSACEPLRVFVRRQTGCGALEDHHRYYVKKIFSALKTLHLCEGFCKALLIVVKLQK